MQVEQLAQDIAEKYSKLSEVEGVVLAGSGGGAQADTHSDVDLYIYARGGTVDKRARAAIIHGRADVYELDNRLWETGDEWIERESGVHVDVMYRDVAWIINEIHQTLEQHRAQLGYSTCIWYNVLHSQALYDRGNWYANLQENARQPYPEPLMVAIVRKNHPVLRKNLSSYLHQIEVSVARDDFVAVQHRVAALVASYFDVLFAINRMPHPGEKRMLDIAELQCDKLPPDLRVQLVDLMYGQDPVSAGHMLIDALDDLLIDEGMLPPR